MYDVPKFIPKIYLIHISGQYWQFKNLEQAAQTLYDLGYFTFWNYYIGDNFKRVWNYDNLTYTEQYKYIVRTELGDIVTCQDLWDIIRVKVKLKRQKKYNYKNKFRDGPISRIRKRRKYKVHRKPRTIQERRESQGCLDEPYKIKIRNKRNHRNLPNSYDDIKRSDYENKNWKEYRKTQYKNKHK